METYTDIEQSIESNISETSQYNNKKHFLGMALVSSIYLIGLCVQVFWS